MENSLREKGLVLLGPIAPPQWGPAVRNRIMLDTFENWGIKVVVLNTLAWKSRPLGFLIDVVKNVWHIPRVILGVSSRGRFVLIPLLVLLKVLKNVKIILYPAGGLFCQEIQALPSVFKWLYMEMLRRLDLICVERPELADQFQSLGVCRPMILPNFKITPKIIQKKEETEIVQLLFLSRIRAVKGVESLLKAADILVGKGYKIQIDFYGIIQPDYEKEFFDLLDKRPFCKYQGVLEYSNVIPAIASYDIMIFPTMVTTEGFPGVLADAAIAGLPVIASDVPSNREIVDDGFNGKLFRPGDAVDLADKLESLIVNKAARLEMGKNNRFKGNAYDVEVVLGDFVKKLTELGWGKE